MCIGIDDGVFFNVGDGVGDEWWRVVGDDVDVFRDEVKGESIGRVLCRSGREFDIVDSFIFVVIYICGIFIEIVFFLFG